MVPIRYCSLANVTACQSLAIRKILENFQYLFVESGLPRNGRRDCAHEWLCLVLRGWEGKYCFSIEAGGGDEMSKVQKEEVVWRRALREDILGN
jgi:hypothetical protein